MDQLQLYNFSLISEHISVYKAKSLIESDLLIVVDVGHGKPLLELLLVKLDLGHACSLHLSYKYSLGFLSVDGAIMVGVELVKD